MNEWAIGIVPLLGVMLGATLQFFLGRLAERRRAGESLRERAYTDYLRAVAAAAQAGTNEDYRNVNRDAADAKARIVVYGSDSVISALARFEELGALVSNAGPSADAFVLLVSAMRPRRSVGVERDIRTILLGPRSTE